MYKAFQDSAAACTTGQQHVRHRDTYAATCTTKETQAQPHVRQETPAQPHVRHRATSATTCTTLHVHEVGQMPVRLWNPSCLAEMQAPDIHVYSSKRMHIPIHGRPTGHLNPRGLPSPHTCQPSRVSRDSPGNRVFVPGQSRKFQGLRWNF